MNPSHKRSSTHVQDRKIVADDDLIPQNGEFSYVIVWLSKAFAFTKIISENVSKHYDLSELRPTIF